jgi:tetratricopeptide (TPR) repeat protein
MFASIEYLTELMHLLLILSGILIVAAMMLSNLIVNFHHFFLRFVSVLLSIIGPPIEILFRILRLLVLEFLFNLVLAQLGKLRSHSAKSIGFILIASLVYLLLLITFQRASLEGIIVLTIFLLLIVDKMFAIKRTKLLLEEVRRLERAAMRASQRRRWYDTLTHFGNALNIYKLPLLAQNPNLDADRADLLEKMGIVLYKDDQFEKALLRFHQALDIYKKPHLVKNIALRKRRVKVLKETAEILYELGRRDEAMKRYELISELVGKSAIPKGFFVRNRRKGKGNW